MKRAVFIITASVAAAFAYGQEEPEMFMGLVVASESRCSPYDRDDYS